MGAIALLGGSFNPLHVGHLRLAIEIHEALGREISRVDILPAAHPPHKAESHVLPFDVRVHLIREAVAPYPWLICNTMEGERSEPSYTWDTLRLLSQREGGREIIFVLGSPDYAQLSSWYHGLDLLERCSLLVAPRGFYSREHFVEDTRRMWPDASLSAPMTDTGITMTCGAARILFQPLPWLEVSSSLIRERWLAGRCIDYLVPRGVALALDERRDEIRRLWS